MVLNSKQGLLDVPLGSYKLLAIQPRGGATPSQESGSRERLSSLLARGGRADLGGHNHPTLLTSLLAPHIAPHLFLSTPRFPPLSLLLQALSPESDLLESMLWGSVAASFMAEAQGVPKQPILDLQVCLFALDAHLREL